MCTCKECKCNPCTCNKNNKQKSFDKLFSKPVIAILALLAILPITPIIISIIYGWSN